MFVKAILAKDAKEGDIFTRSSGMQYRAISVNEHLAYIEIQTDKGSLEFHRSDVLGLLYRPLQAGTTAESLRAHITRLAENLADQGIHHATDEQYRKLREAIENYELGLPLPPEKK